MKLTKHIATKIGNFKAMIAGGLGKKGPYVYGGVKHKSGLSAGVSVGTLGKQAYASYNNKFGQARVKHNFRTNISSPRIKPSKNIIKKLFGR